MDNLVNSSDALKIAQEHHTKELRDRIKACTPEEQEEIAKVIAKDRPEILLAALFHELNRREATISRFKKALEREDT